MLDKSSTDLLDCDPVDSTLMCIGIMAIREREYCTTVSAANTDPRVSCVRPVCACCLL
jgi:hypothetical protein